MTENNKNKAIVIFGVSESGKTTIGKLLSEKSKCRFLMVMIFIPKKIGHANLAFTSS